MPTVVELLTQAHRDINVLGVDETMSADMAADGLATLNQMIGQWQTEKLYVYAQKVVAVTANGSQTYTIGAGGDISTVLPSRIDSAVWRNNGVDIPLINLQSLQDWEKIGVKLLSGTPECFFFQRSYPMGTIYVWPQASVGELRFVTRDLLPEYDSLTNDMSLPPEYALAVRFSLAELLGLQYGTPASNLIAQRAANARRVMKRNNTQILEMGMPYGIHYDWRYNIYSDR